MKSRILKNLLLSFTFLVGSVMYAQKVTGTFLTVQTHYQELVSRLREALPVQKLILMEIILLMQILEMY